MARVAIAAPQKPESLYPRNVAVIMMGPGVTLSHGNPVQEIPWC